jgi:hypothetical protein
MANIINLTAPHQANSAGFTQGGDTVIQSGIMTPIVQVGGNTNDTADQRLRSMLGYGIDIYNDIKKYKTERHPTLSILMNKAKPLAAKIVSESESMEDGQFFANEFDTLRRRTPFTTLGADYNRAGYLVAPAGAKAKVPLAISASTFIGGEAEWFATEVTAKKFADSRTGNQTTTGLFIGASSVDTISIASCAEYGGDMIGLLGYKANAGGILGNVAMTVQKHMVNLQGFGYEYSNKIDVDTDGTAYVAYGVNYIAGSSTRNYMLFDNLALGKTENSATTGTIGQKHQIKVGIEGFFFLESMAQFVFVLNFNDSNLDWDWAVEAGAAKNLMLVRELSKGVTFKAGNTSTDISFTGYFNIHPVFKAGDASTAPQGVPEGSSKTQGKTFKRNFKQYSNHVQIFRADSWSITGTEMAMNKARFMDAFADTREQNLFMYKDKLTAAFLYGRESEQSVYNSTKGVWENLRTMSGLTDREKFPIKIIRMTLSQSYSSAYTASLALETFISELGEALTAFTSMTSNPTITIPCSKAMLRDLQRLATIGQSQEYNLFGKLASGTQETSSATLNLPIVRFQTGSCTLIFTYEPGLDFATKLDLPYYLTGRVSPRKVMMAFSNKDMDTYTVRGDKIQGNIQNPGDDLYEEDIIGEHGFMMRNCRRQCLIIVD